MYLRKLLKLSRQLEDLRRELVCRLLSTYDFGELNLRKLFNQNVNEQILEISTRIDQVSSTVNQILFNQGLKVCVVNSNTIHFCEYTVEDNVNLFGCVVVMEVYGNEVTLRPLNPQSLSRMDAERFATVQEWSKTV